MEYILAIIIFPVNPTTASGWKVSDPNPDDPNICSRKHGQTFIQCVEENTFKAEDILNSSNDFLKIKLFFIKNFNGLAASAEITNQSVISFDWWSTRGIYLNTTLSYVIHIMDTKLQFITASQDLIPRYVLPLKPQAGQTSIFFTAIRHEKLNQVSRALQFGNLHCDKDKDTIKMCKLFRQDPLLTNRLFQVSTNCLYAPSLNIVLCINHITIRE